MKVLSDSQRVEIVEMYETGRYTMRELAAQFHIATSSVWKVIHGQEKKKKRFVAQVLKPNRNKEAMRRKFNRVDEVRKLIQTVSEFSIVDNWTDLYLMQILLSCGLTKEDFENAGYIDFYDDCLNIK